MEAIRLEAGRISLCLHLHAPWLRSKNLADFFSWNHLDLYNLISRIELDPLGEIVEGMSTLEDHWDISTELGSGPYPETSVCPLDGAEMVLVPKGPFIMGITKEELRQIFMLDQRQTPVFATEIPGRTVSLEAYYIDRYPVTNYQYRRFVEETEHREPLLWN